MHLALTILVAAIALVGAGTTSERLAEARTATATSMTTNQRMRLAMTEAEEKTCAGLADILVDRTIEEFERYVKAMQRGQMPLPMQTRVVSCFGPEGLVVSPLKLWRDKLCDPVVHDLVVACNSSQLLKGQQRDLFKTLEPNVDYFLSVVSLRTDPSQACQCE